MRWKMEIELYLTMAAGNCISTVWKTKWRQGTTELDAAMCVCVRIAITARINCAWFERSRVQRLLWGSWKASKTIKQQQLHWQPLWHCGCGNEHSAPTPLRVATAKCNKCQEQLLYLCRLQVSLVFVWRRNAYKYWGFSMTNTMSCQLDQRWAGAYKYSETKCCETIQKFYFWN